ncbi:Hypothetical protein R9X50_00588000 [Acrodontium crateriforme]|uniref:Uncharacterized protein n=1 Tax=Acrodontium crateriforme TaxID=150365 RepID=A0AAQ3R6C6_9PEZI|nr:Hypothetical protein R9X50_00588000 [Acrodontium crateriforme]
MSIFKRKSTKAKKEAESKQKDQAAADQPPKQPYKHIPKHAGTDSAITGGNGNQELDRHRIRQANQRRMSMGRDNLPTPNPVYAQSLHGAPPTPSIRSGMSRHTIGPGGFGPQTPLSPMERAYGKTRANSDYFGKNDQQMHSFDSSMLGTTKMSQAARDRAYQNPHHSADSGYGSAGPDSAIPSRSPSEQAFYTDVSSSQPAAASSSGTLLPELSLGEKLSKDRAISEHSFGGADDDEIVHQTKRAPESAMKRSSLSNPSADFSSDARPAKSSKAVSKQTRFEQPEEAVPPLPLQYQQEQREQLQMQASQSEQYYESHQIPHKSQTYSEQSAQRDAHVMSTPAHYAPVPRPSHEPREMKTFAPRNAHFSSPDVYAPSSHSSSQRNLQAPSLSILEGFKVNRKGKLLDEEGDLIGELYEGDLAECVRLKADAQGHVIDEYGSIVGRVRTIPRQQDSSILLSSSLLASRKKSEEVFHTAHERRESIISEPESSPEQNSQHQVQPKVSYDGESPLPIHAPRAVRPVDVDSDVACIDLDASQHNQAAVDHSDIFLPEFRRSTPSQASSEQSDSPITQGANSHRDAEARSSFQQRGESLTVNSRNQASATSPTSPSFSDAKSRRNPLVRSTSEGSISDMSTKSFTRLPTMDPVPEDGNVPVEEFDPAKYKYKGEIPPVSRDVGPRSASPRGAMSSPSMPYMMPKGVPSTMSPHQFLSAPVGSPRKVQYAAGVPGMRSSRSNSKHSLNQPMRRSPLSSHENSPPESEESNSDDGKLNAYLQMPSRPPMHARAASVRTTHSVRSTTSMATNGKPRVYFTHTGRIPVNEMPPPPPIPADVKGKKDQESTPSIADKKKKRFSLFGKKDS